MGASSSARPATVERRQSPYRQQLRGLLGLLLALVLIAATFGIGIEPAQARGHTPDTIVLVTSQGRFTLLSSLSPSANTRVFTFGNPGDVPLMGDWDCDGDESPGVYRPSTARLYLRNSNTSGIADKSYVFGNPGDSPVAGDFNKNRCDTVSVYRSSESMVYIKNQLSDGIADSRFMFGNPADRVFSGDFDGDGFDTIGLRRDVVGAAFLARTNASGLADTLRFGNPGDQVVAGDWNGNGIQTVGVYRPSTGWFYYRNHNTTGVADGSLYVGRGFTVLTASGINPKSITGDPLKPVEPEPKPEPKPEQDAPPAPVSTGGSVSVAGFAPPPPRPVSGPIDVSGQSDVVIENVHVSNPGGDCVVVTNASNVTIRNSTIGPCGDEAVYLSDVDGAVVEGNYITGTGNGVLVHRSESVRVDGNAFVEAGRNFVQFDKVNGPGSSVSGNRGQNELGGSNAEDLISLYLSNGTASSPIMVVGNHLRNGGPSDSGSGIMLGDGGGSYQFVEGNVLVDPGQVGIGVASGTNMTVRGNRIYSSSVPWSNVGLYVWNQYGSACGNVEVSGNQVNWTNADGSSNGWWGGGGCGEVNFYGNDLNASVGPNDF